VHQQLDLLLGQTNPDPAQIGKLNLRRSTAALFSIDSSRRKTVNHSFFSVHGGVVPSSG
jgi:hypothetical protein